MRASPVGRETPIGGDYDWNGPGTGADSYGVYLFDGDPGSFALIDELGDDGSLATGSIVFESPRLHFKLEPAP